MHQRCMGWLGFGGEKKKARHFLTNHCWLWQSYNLVKFTINSLYDCMNSRSGWVWHLGYLFFFFNGRISEIACRVWLPLCEKRGDTLQGRDPCEEGMWFLKFFSWVVGIRSAFSMRELGHCHHYVLLLSFSKWLLCFVQISTITEGWRGRHLVDWVPWGIQTFFFPH